MYFGYTGAFNVLDYSVAVVPVTRVDKEKDVVTDENKGKGGELGELDKAVWGTCE